MLTALDSDGADAVRMLWAWVASIACCVMMPTIEELRAPAEEQRLTALEMEGPFICLALLRYVLLVVMGGFFDTITNMP